MATSRREEKELCRCTPFHDKYVSWAHNLPIYAVVERTFRGGGIPIEVMRWDVIVEVNQKSELRLIS